MNSLIDGEETPKVSRRPKKAPLLTLGGDELVFDRMSSRIGSWDFKDMEQSTVAPSITAILS